jgi:hypothetical protein
MANPINTLYQNVSAITITLASLANDSTNLVAGRESTAIDNGTNVYPDVHVSGRITTGTSPTANNSIEVWAYGSIDDSPNSVVYPGGVTGSDAAITFASMNVKRTALRPVARISVDNTSNRSYDFAEVSIARLFNGMPRHWGIVVINGSGAALHATSGNHFINMKPCGFQVV